MIEFGVMGTDKSVWVKIENRLILVNDLLIEPCGGSEDVGYRVIVNGYTIVLVDPISKEEAEHILEEFYTLVGMSWPVLRVKSGQKERTNAETVSST